MVYHTTTKNFKFSNSAKQLINGYIKKLVKFTSDFDLDLLLLDLIIEKHREKRLNRSVEDNIDEPEIKIVNINPKVSNPIYYYERIMLRLPKKPLIVNVQSTSIVKTISIGFDRLIKKLETYKGKHFSSYSKYYDHRSIRKEQV